MNNEEKIGMKNCAQCGDIKTVEDCISYYEGGLHPETLKYFCSHGCLGMYVMETANEKTEPGKIINTNAKNSKNEFNYDELTTLLVLVQVEIIASGNLLIFADHGSGTYKEITDRIDSLVILRDKITNKLISFNFVAA